MQESRVSRIQPDIPESASSNSNGRPALVGSANRSFGFPGLRKRGHGHGNRSWIKIDQEGNSKVLELDKATIMRHCSLPARDLRLLDPLFIYPSTILGREKAIVVSLEQIRCIITADEVILMNSLDVSVVQYESEFCRRLQANNNQAEDLPFEFRALELALELTCMSLDAQVQELESEIYPVLDELTSSINTLNLERARRLKGHLLALTQRVQKVHDEIEHLMDDDGDMAEMYLTEKKQRSEAYSLGDLDLQHPSLGGNRVFSNSAPVSPARSNSGTRKLQRAFSSIVSPSKHGSSTNSLSNEENIDQLEMLLEAYFIAIDNTLSKLSSVSKALRSGVFLHIFVGLYKFLEQYGVDAHSALISFIMLQLKEYIDDTEDLINIKLGNVQNQLIQFELLLTAATFVTTIFTVVAGIFGMNFETSTVFDHASTFNWVIIITSFGCACLYLSFLFYFKYKKVFPL